MFCVVWFVLVACSVLIRFRLVVVLCLTFGGFDYLILLFACSGVEFDCFGDLAKIGNFGDLRVTLVNLVCCVILIAQYRISSEICSLGVFSCFGCVFHFGCLCLVSLCCLFWIYLVLGISDFVWWFVLILLFGYEILALVVDLRWRLVEIVIFLEFLVKGGLVDFGLLWQIVLFLLVQNWF